MQTPLTTNTLTSSYVLEALLQHNYLPNQREDREELPPSIATTSFSDSLAASLASSQEFSKRRKHGYDSVEHKMTRFNGAVRVLSIPHPTPYANLALSITSNWENIKYITHNSNSKVIPMFHPDGRIIIMDYENIASRTKEILGMSFGQYFVVRADISNCFPSIYSHSIPWALVGMPTAKLNTSNRYWYNRIDTAVRLTKRNETNGIPIGPATSNIIAEIILAKVDEVLASRFTYLRYIDDYTAYCETQEEAQEFILRLIEELSKYKLMINNAKTDIKPLPQMSASDWVVALKSTLPQRSNLSIHNAVNYLDFVVGLAKESPDGSVLKYGVKSLIGVLLGSTSVGHSVVKSVLEYTLNLSFHHAVLIPLLERLFDRIYLLEYGFHHGDAIQKLLWQHTRLRHSDAISWLLYFAIKYNVPIEDRCSSRIVESEDCIPMLLLHLSAGSSHQQKVIDFVNAITQPPVDVYKLDQYWILLYQLFHDNLIGDPYSQINSLRGVLTSFEIMKQASVDFVTPPPPLPPLPVIV